MKYNKTKSNKRGFTIVELMISTVIFSLVMLLCLTGMMQVSRAYYKGITYSRTQETARNLMTEISQVIQLSGSSVSFSTAVPGFTQTGPTIAIGSTANGSGAFCAGNKKYSYALDRKVTQSPVSTKKELKNALISEDAPCVNGIVPSSKLSSGAALSGTERSLLGNNMRLTKFAITKVVPNAAVNTKPGSHIWRIEISIAYGDQDLFGYVDPNNINSRYKDDQERERVICKPGTGTEFCSIVELSTIVSRRIG